MQLYLLLTENCNLNCSMCIRGQQNGINLDYNVLKNLQWLEEIKNYDVIVTGGEPTLYPEFEKIVNLLCSYGGNVIVTTNGTTDYYVKNDFIKDNLFFQLSIDGDRNKHNEIRGKGTFEKTFKTAKKLNDICAKFSIASTVSRKNFENMPLLAKELEKLENLRYWRLSYEMPFGSANFKDMLSSNEWNNFVDKILDIAKLRVRIKKIFPFELYDKKKEDIDKLILNNRHCFNCGSGKDKVYIYPDFNVYPCTCLTDFCIGNLKEKTLDQILSCEAITLFTEYKTCNNSICNNCEYIKYCNGGCIGMSYHYFKKLGMGDVRCPKLGVLR